MAGTAGPPGLCVTNLGSRRPGRRRELLDQVCAKADCTARALHLDKVAPG
jgi:hypothetical protein